MLSRAEKPEYERPSSILYYKVDDIARSCDELKGKGVRFDGPPHIVHQDARHELWMASFKDSEGNPLLLMSEKPR